MESSAFFRRSLLVSLLCSTGALHPAKADVKMPGIFGDHMVLQQGAKLPVWGWADAGEKVTVSFAGKSGSSVAGSDGKWRVDLPPVPAGGEARVLNVAGKNKLTFQDVLVGNVWIASGQSNMEFGIQTDSRATEAIASANDPQIRMFFVPWATSLEPKADIAEPRRGSAFDGKWQVCTPELMGAPWAWHGFSAVGYYFAREIRRTTKAPVGMIATYKGGTPAQAWTSLSGLEKDPVLAHYLADHKKVADGYQDALATFPKRNADYQEVLKEWNAGAGKAYNEALAKWNTEVQQAKAAGQAAPPKPQPATPQPRPPVQPDGGFSVPSTLFNAMVSPLIPFSINGVIWYQGESNGDNLAAAKEYSILFPRMINDWREKWAQPGDFSFLFVQLANFKAAPKTPSEGAWAWVREAQLKALALPKTGMASAVDVGDAGNIHPTDKLDVGLRLSLAARHAAYGENLVYSGPTYDSMKIEGNKIRIGFKNRGGGLMMGVPPWTPDGNTPPAPTALNGFGIAGEDQKFVWAKAAIEGDTVVVSSDQISKPVAVRYGWADNPQGNLYNKEKLPASPFRTDAWAP